MGKEDDRGPVGTRRKENQKKIEEIDMRLIAQYHRNRGWPVQTMCEILGVSRSVYYKWLNLQPYKKLQELEPIPIQ